MIPVRTRIDKKSRNFLNLPSLWQVLLFVTILKKNTILRILVRVVLISLFLSSLYSVLSGQDTLVFSITTDDFPNETFWTISNGNTYEIYSSSEGLVLQANSTYNDTILLPSVRCIRLAISDSGGDGIGSVEGFSFSKNGTIFQQSESIGFEFNQVYFCSEGLVCEEAINLNEGSELLKEADHTWYEIRPVFDTYYMMITTSACDTEMWIYDECGKDHPTDHTGAIWYNDDFDGKRAGFSQIRLNGGEIYYVRISQKELCGEHNFFYVVDLKIKDGCMDVDACNFDPLANLDDGSCFYGSCAPDLAINREAFIQSVYLDSIFNEDEDCLVAEGCLQGYGKRDIIRFTTQIDNVGDADYIVGEPQEDSNLFSEQNCHEHWHYLGYAEYLIFDGEGQPEPVGFKNGFCALDFICEDESSYKYDCNYMGISAGCFDTYESDLLCQWVDVTDLPDGDYTLVVRVNYNQENDLFGRRERSFENNWQQVCINLDRTSGHLAMTMIESCSDYTDCLGFRFGPNQLDCNGVCGGNAHYGDFDGDQKLSTADVNMASQMILDNDISFSNCHNLNGDDKLTVYDVVLLHDCIINNPYQEANPFHLHCDFPRSIDNEGDSVFIRIGSVDFQNKSLQLEYKSNVDLRALDITFEGAVIDSVESSISESQFLVNRNGSRILINIPEQENYMVKSSDFRTFSTLHLNIENEQQFCISKIMDAINKRSERISTKMDQNCISFETTNVYERELKGKIEIFPNPVAEKLHIRSVENAKIQEILIRNMSGVVIKSLSENGSRNRTIDLSFLQNGLYLVETRTELGAYSQYVVKI